MLRVLLKYGIDPNEPSANLISSEKRAFSAFFLDANKLIPDCVIEESFDTQDDTSSLANNGKDTLALVGQSSKTHDSRKASEVSLQLPPEKPRATFLISPDFDLNYTDEELYKLPPLFIAIQYKKELAVFLILEFGANPNVQDKLGNSPLHLAASEQYYSQEICSQLLRKGAQVKMTNKQGTCPLDIRPNLADLQQTVIKEMLAGKSGSQFSLDKGDTLKVGGKRVSWSSNSDSNSRSFGRSGSIKKKLFRRSESKEKEKAARERRRNERLESTSTGNTGSLN